MPVQVVAVAARAGAQAGARAGAAVARGSAKVAARAAQKVAGSAAQNAQRAAGSAARGAQRSAGSAARAGSRPAGPSGPGTGRPSSRLADARRAYDRVDRARELGGDDRERRDGQPGAGSGSAPRDPATAAGGRSADAAARLADHLRRSARRRVDPRRAARDAVDPRRLARRGFLLTAILAIVVVLTLVLPYISLAQAEDAAEAYEEALDLTSLVDTTGGTGCPGTIVDVAARTAIPTTALEAYCSAALARGVDWAILAGVGKQECDHGRSPLAGCNPRGTVNHKGARGPMQFLGSTWRSSAGQYDLEVAGPAIPEGRAGGGYATDGDGDGIADPWTWLDATHSAARMLAHHGVGSDPRAALHAYNPVQAYIDDVMDHAAGYRSATADLLPVGAPLGSTEPYPYESQMQPQLRRLVDVLVPLFGRGYAVYCYGLRDGPSEHPIGRACDFMMAPGGTEPNEQYLAHGWRMVHWLIAHATEYQVSYVIWQEQIWENGEGWSKYTRYPNGSLTEKHVDHVHISVY